MKCDKKNMLLYAVTDRSWVGERTLYDQVREALEGGVTCVQLREKELDEAAALEEAIAIRDLCHSYHVPFIINDNAALAVKCQADGVHVGQDDMPVEEVRKIVGENMIIGATAHNVEEAVAAEKAGADYLGCGAVFGSTTKNNTIPLSMDTLKQITASVNIPIVAIAGISLDNIHKLKGTGIDGVAVVSAIFAAENIVTRTKALKAASKSVVNSAQIKTAVAIAGSDSSGGAGIQADLKTMTMNGVFGMTAITALTAQNTTGVTGISEVTPDFLEAQIDAVFTDIYPDAVKIGMVSSAPLIEVISRKLQEYKAHNIVVDPVMVATSGSSLLASDSVIAMKELLLPLATVITPNIPEGEVLSGMTITNEEEMVAAAKYMHETYHCAVLLKGGHSINDANDLLYANGEAKWFKGKRIPNDNTHGTGCTLSSAIASNLAKGYDLETAVQRAKDYISGALAAMLDLGMGSGPMQHNFNLQGEFAEENH